MLQAFIDGIVVTVYPILFIGLIAGDKRELAIYSVLYSVYWVVSMGSIGFSSGIAIRVGLLLGSNEPQKAKKSALLGIIIGIISLLPSSIILLTLSKQLSYLFTSEAKFANELDFDFRISSILIFRNLNFIVQGLMNACCKQGTVAALKIIFNVILGSILVAILVHYVSWKGLSIFLQYVFTCLPIFIIIFLILFCSDWSKIAQRVVKNTNTDTILEMNSRKNSTVFLLCRYSMCLFLGFCILTIVVILDVYAVY